MLILARSLRELRFGELMQVYSDSNLQRARDWPYLPVDHALQLAEQDEYHYLKTVFFRTPGAVLMIWEESDGYVSAARLEPYRDGLLLAGVETAPFSRRCGYARKLIRGIQELLPDLGANRVYSHVHKNNTPSRRLHEGCGFRKISDIAVYLDGSVDSRSVTLVYEK